MRFAKPQAIKTNPGGTGHSRELTGNWMYWAESLKTYVTIPDADTVCDGCECPQCNENRVDELVWYDSTEGEYVECATCDAWYDPNEEG